MPWLTIGPYEQYETFVDDQDVHLLEKYYWLFDGRYVKRKVNGKRNGPDKPRDPSKVFYLHREIMQPEEGLHVDHVDGNSLNNARSNLRCVLQKENNKNIDAVGATYLPHLGKWAARITHNYKSIHIGVYETFDEAVQAFRNKSNELRGEMSRWK